MRALATLSFLCRHACRRDHLLVAVGLPLACGAYVAHAQDESNCVDPRLHVDGTLAAVWSGALRKICEMLRTMPDADPSAELRLIAAGEDVVVHVTLADGRWTLRRVRPGEDLLRTVEALVAMPPAMAPARGTAPASGTAAIPGAAADGAQAGPPGAPERVAPTPGPEQTAVKPQGAEPARAPTSPVPASESAGITMRPEASHADRDRALGFELGGSAVGRLAGSPLYGSVGMMGYAGLRLRSWLLACGARWDGYQTVLRKRPEQFEMSTAGGGFLVLRRFVEAHALALEGGLTTWLLSELQEREEGERERGGTVIGARMGALARLLWGQRAVRGTVSLDMEVAPGRLREGVRLDERLPLLPAWSIGLGAGVAWQS